MLHNDKDKFFWSKDEKFYLTFIVIIFNLVLTFFISVMSEIRWKFPINPDAYLLDFLRRFSVVFFFIGFIFMLYQLAHYKPKKLNTLIISFFITFLIFSLYFSFGVVKDKIEELNHISFDEGVVGAVYIWNADFHNGTGSQNIHMMLLKAGEKWLSSLPTKFLLEYNNTKYKNCRLQRIIWKEKTMFPEVDYYNNSSCVIVKWSEKDLGNITGYVPHWYIDFLLTWDTDNKTIPKPEKYDILVDFEGWKNVCKGVICYSPDEPDWHSKYWWEQLHDSIFINEHSC